jgi:1-deoxy-D-xylulose-5-phosphate reductoisomerase
VLNGANEVAVAAFLNDEIAYLDIARLLTTVLDRHDVESRPSLERLLAADRWARAEARALIEDGVSTSAPRAPRSVA